MIEIGALIAWAGPVVLSAAISAVVGYFSAQKQTETKLIEVQVRLEDAEQEIARLRDDAFKSLDVRLRAIEVQLSAVEALLRALSDQRR